MKITYPECQVEITAEEFITVIDHFMTKVTCNTEPTFEPGGIISTDDDMPEPKPYPEAGEKVIPSTSEDGVFLSSAMRRFFESEEKRQQMEDKLTEKSRQRIVDCENTLEEVINGGDTQSITGALAGLEDAWLNAETKPVETPEPAPTESKKEPAPTKRKTNSKKVQVLFENGWKTFSSISQAAKAIDARLNHLSHALLNGKTCNGHQVRYATGNKEQTQPANEEQTELP